MVTYTLGVFSIIRFFASIVDLYNEKEKIVKRNYQASDL